MYTREVCCLKAVPGAPVLPDVRLGRKVADNIAGCTHVLGALCCVRPGWPLAPACHLARHELTEDDQAIRIQAFYSSSPVNKMAVLCRQSMAHPPQETGPKMLLMGGCVVSR